MEYRGEDASRGPADSRRQQPWQSYGQDAGHAPGDGRDSNGHGWQQEYGNGGDYPDARHTGVGGSAPPDGYARSGAYAQPVSYPQGGEYGTGGYGNPNGWDGYGQSGQSGQSGQFEQSGGNSHPGYEQPDYEQPGFERPGYGQPEYGQPEYGDPGYGQPQQYAQPDYGQSQRYGQRHEPPGYGNPGYGDASYGQPEYGDAGYGRPEYGDPGYGQPQQYAQPDYGQSHDGGGYGDNDWYGRGGSGFADTSTGLPAIAEQAGPPQQPPQQPARPAARAGFPPALPAPPSAATGHSDGLTQTRQQPAIGDARNATYPGYEGVEDADGFGNAGGYAPAQGYDDYDDYAAHGYDEPGALGGNGDFAPGGRAYDTNGHGDTAIIDEYGDGFGGKDAYGHGGYTQDAYHARAQDVYAQDGYPDESYGQGDYGQDSYGRGDYGQGRYGAGAPGSADVLGAPDMLDTADTLGAPDMLDTVGTLGTADQPGDGGDGGKGRNKGRRGKKAPDASAAVRQGEPRREEPRAGGTRPSRARPGSRRAGSPQAGGAQAGGAQAESTRTGGSRVGTPRDRKSRARRRIVVSSLAVVVLIAAIGAIYMLILKPKNSASTLASPNAPLPAVGSSSGASAISACQKQLGTFCHIELRSEDPAPLTMSEVFPPIFLNRTDKLSFQRIATRMDTSNHCASAVFGSQLVTQLKDGGCTQFLRATYVAGSGSSEIVGTIGVANLNTTNDAHHAGRVVGTNDFIAPVTTTKGPGKNVGQGNGLSQATYKGHYLILVWAQLVGSTSSSSVSSAQQREITTFESDLQADTVNIALSQRMVNGKPSAAGS